MSKGASNGHDAGDSSRFAAVTPKLGTERLHAADATRAFAFILGIFYHATFFFIKADTYRVVVDHSTSKALILFAYGCHSFRMELFFLIAGFFARLMVLKRGGADFARNRFSRILVPFVLGWIVLFPVFVCLFLWNSQINGHWTFLDFPPEQRMWNPVALAVNAILSGKAFHKVDLAHLWFLHQLIFIYLLFFAVRAVFMRFPSAGASAQKWEDLFARCLRSKWRLPVLALATAPCLLLMRRWEVDIPNTSLLPYVPTTLLYGGIFACGWWLHRKADLLFHSAGRWHMAMAVGVMLVVPTFITSLLGDAHWLKNHPGLLNEPVRTWIEHNRLVVSVLWAFAYACMMWGFIFGWTGFFFRYCSRPSGWGRYLAEASYWIYLAHLPLLMLLHILIYPWPIHWSIKWPLLSLLTLVLLIFSYQWMVRSTFIGRLLNGRKQPWQLWPWQSAATLR